MYRLNYVKFLSYTLAVALALLQILPHFASDATADTLFPAETEGWSDGVEKAHTVVVDAVNHNSRDAVFKWRNGIWVMTQSWNGKPLPDTREIICPQGHGTVIARKKKGTYLGGSVPPIHEGYEGEVFRAPYLFYTSYEGICRYREKAKIVAVTTDEESPYAEESASADSHPEADAQRELQDTETVSQSNMPNDSIDLDARVAADDRLRLYCRSIGPIFKIEAIIFKDTVYEKTISLNRDAGDSGLWIREYDYSGIDLPNGEYTTVFHAYTNDGRKVSREYRNTFLFLNIEYTEIKGEWNKWENMRFMGYEKIRIKVRLNREAERVEVRFSPELEAMRYTNSKGIPYDYREELGYEVTFPITAERTANRDIPEWEASYVLPVARSTIDWNDIRLYKPYKAYIKATTGHNEVIKEIELDLTGNVHDLLYIRPLIRQ